MAAVPAATIMCFPQTYTISTPFAEYKKRECRCRPMSNLMTVAHDNGSELREKKRRGAEPSWADIRFTVVPTYRDRLAPGTRAFFPMLSGTIIPTRSAAPISEMCLFSCRGYNEQIVGAVLHLNLSGVA